MHKFTLSLILAITVMAASAQVQIDSALNFSVKSIHGETLELYPILDEGKLVVIDFFSTSCGPCALYAPDVEASYQDFGANSGNVFFMSIAWGDDNAGVAYFDSIYGVTHPSVSGSQGGGNMVHNAYMVQSTPSVILIAPDREIIENYIWEPSHENLNAAILAAGGILVGTNEQEKPADQEILVYPNPASDKVHVRFETQRNATYQIDVYNLTGSLAHQGEQLRLSPGIHLLETNLSGLPGGTYFLRLLENGEQRNINRLILLD